VILLISSYEVQSCEVAKRYCFY